MPTSINSKRLIFNALFQIYLMWALDKDYIRSSQYPQPVWAEEMRSIVSKPWHETLNSIQGFETA
ncbi:hypothetical protein N748_04525 [Legionella pneumophila str. 121004]|nr:hypothetical protein N748_04525 [Legionella pneumophila str. 121004]ERH42113.1 hypothetical protein N750_14955 [Legionella pneumophila str. Leg01/53]ERH45172.1 hypothetical protein N751_00600 [Legionella pneumophila str. Leg01/11]